MTTEGRLLSHTPFFAFCCKLLTGSIFVICDKPSCAKAGSYLISATNAILGCGAAGKSGLSTLTIYQGFAKLNAGMATSS